MGRPTPGPWRAYLDRGYSWIESETAGTVARELTTGDADLIVRAVNAHEELVGLLRWLNQRGGLGLDVHDRIDAALKKAGAP